MNPLLLALLGQMVPALLWLLVLGNWNDGGVWDDAAIWNDGNMSPTFDDGTAWDDGAIWLDA